ncbi:hypothetical protein J6590_094665 [Homalodisca vitripennis]|nr:hypothetical protein J6590_094665 [Homalodisca vitripennis]
MSNPDVVSSKIETVAANNVATSKKSFNCHRSRDDTVTLESSNLGINDPHRYLSYSRYLHNDLPLNIRSSTLPIFGRNMPNRTCTPIDEIKSYFFDPADFHILGI